MGSSLRLTRRVITARVLEIITRWGEASRNQLRQYGTHRADLLDAVLAELEENLVLERAMVPPHTSCRYQREWVEVWRLRPARKEVGATSSAPGKHL